MKRNKAFLVFILASLLIQFPGNSYVFGQTGNSDTVDTTPREVGDILQIALPGIAFGTTLVLRDWQGLGQMTKVTVAQVFTVGTIKLLVAKRRPDDGDRKSYPSGHTAGAFSGAAFIHHRYGWGWSVPMYIGAVYTAYSRVYAEKHWTADVWSGAAVASIWAWYITTPYEKKKNLSLVPDIRDGYSGVHMTYKFGGNDSPTDN